MRVITFILALFILSLSVQPCCADECSNEDTQTSCNDCEQHDEEEQGACSPFFNCGNCPGNGFEISSFYLAPPVTVYLQPSAVYLQPFHTWFSQPVWQPPKLS